ncbi:MAG: uroporphyrinogen-III synthase [Gemmatimonadaceae bacterium]
MRPLDGRRVAVTRAREQSDELGALLASLGAEVLYCATIEILPPLDWRPLDAAIQSLATFDWIVFTSRNAVDHFHARLVLSKVDDKSMAGVRIAAVGTGTRDALSTRGMRADVIPPKAMANRIPESLGPIEGLRILLPRSEIAAPELPAALCERGADVVEVVTHRTARAGGAALLVERVREHGVDAITFASASAVRSFVGAAADMIDSGGWWRDPNRPRIVAIGPVTASAATELKVPIDRVATAHDVDSLARAVVDCLSNSPVKPSHA